jgi:hypothetical protein
VISLGMNHQDQDGRKFDLVFQVRRDKKLHGAVTRVLGR